MSGVAAVRYILANAAGVIAVVPAARIFRGITLPQGTVLPALGVSQVSDVERATVAMAETKRLMVERVQVTLHAATYDAQKALLVLVRAALGHRTGTTNGVDLVSILPGGTGPDGYEPDPITYSQTVDYLVAWRRSA